MCSLGALVCKAGGYLIYRVHPVGIISCHFDLLMREASEEDVRALENCSTSFSFSEELSMAK